jgi:tryptophan synthase alpha subunit
MTTGSKAEFGEKFEKYISNLKYIFSCNIWVGFWVKTKQDVEKVNKISDFAIIWSEFIKRHHNWWAWEIEKYLKEITE